MPGLHPHSSSDSADRLAAIEQRLARIEAQLGLDAPTNPAESAARPHSIRAASSAEELEVEVGQYWFAPAGVTALTLGAALLLALPFPRVPAGVPPSIGYGVVAALFVLAHHGCRSFELVGRYLRGSAMALLFCSTFRWCFPLSRRVMDVDSAGAHALLIFTVIVNLWIGLRRRSPWLTGLGLACGGMVTASSSAHWLEFGGLVSLAMVAIFVSERERWKPLTLAATLGGYATYLGFTLGPLFQPSAGHFMSHPVAPAILLACTVVFASGSVWNVSEDSSEAWLAVQAMLNCLVGYGIFLVHTAAAFSDRLATAHCAAFAVFLGIAIAYWVRRRSRGATFFYAMTGYLALSVALLKAASAPDVFVWLSLQSLIVITTAIWFRSRFIVVANFFIYVAIVLAYGFATEHDSGISVGFGLVALVSARILNWQKDRLELKTELMRNAYLASAFLVFPYALYHLVPTRYAAVAWVALSSVYYGLNLIVRNPKYRWMGHATLLLTMVYLVVVGVSRFEPADRVLSFLVLGAVLLVVSLSFARARRRKQAP